MISLNQYNFILVQAVISTYVFGIQEIIVLKRAEIFNGKSKDKIFIYSYQIIMNKTNEKKNRKAKALILHKNILFWIHTATTG